MDKPIRILYVIGSLEVGGAERQLVELLARLDRKRFEPVLCCLGYGGPLEARVIEAGVYYRCFRFQGIGGGVARNFRALMSLASLYVFMLRFRPKIVHCYLYWANIIGALLARLAFVPVVITSRRSLGLYKEKHGYMQGLENLVNRFTDAITVNSRGVMDDVYNRERIHSAKVRLIYNGVDPDPVCTIAKEEFLRSLGVPHGWLLLVCVANLHAYKGHVELLQAVALVRQMCNDPFVLVCVGRDAGELQRLEELSLELGLKERVFFVGPRSDAAGMLRLADIAVLASHEEGFSNAILEGMAAGVPQVVTSVGGNREAVQDGVTGFVVPPKQPQRLAQALTTLLTDEALRKAMGNEARTTALRRFSYSAMVGETQALYEETLSSR